MVKDRQASSDRNIRDLWVRGKFWEIFGLSSSEFTTLELAKQYSTLTKAYRHSPEDMRMIDGAFATLNAPLTRQFYEGCRMIMQRIKREVGDTRFGDAEDRIWLDLWDWVSERWQEPPDEIINAIKTKYSHRRDLEQGATGQTEMWSDEGLKPADLDSVMAAEAFVKEVKCQHCGKFDHTLRVVAFPYVISILIASFRRVGDSGIFCHRCRCTKSIKWAIVSLLFGWWSIWGFFWNIGAIIDNFRGGKMPRENNEPLIARLAWTHMVLGKIAEAKAAIRDLLKYGHSEETLQLKRELDTKYPEIAPAKTGGFRLGYLTVVFVILGIYVIAGIAMFGGTATTHTAPPQVTPSFTPPDQQSQTSTPALSFVENEVKNLAPKLKEVCTSTETTDIIPATGPILVVWADSGEVEMDIQKLFIESAQPKSEDDIVFVAGLTKREIVESHYTDGQPGYRIDYNVKLFLYDGAKLVKSLTLEGYETPFIKHGSGPAYGDPPLENVAGWLAEQTNTRVFGVLGAHDKPVTSLEFSPDGRILASASEDKTVRLWNIASGQEIATLSGHTDEVKDIAFSPDGQLLASAGYELEVRLWNVAIYTLDRTIQACYFGYGINSLDFSPNGSILATAGWLCGGVTLWDITNGQSIETIADDVSPSFVVFSSSGHLLAWDEYEENGNDQKVVIWDTVTKNTIYEFHMGESTPHCAAFSPDNTLLAVGDWDNHITMWNVSNGDKLNSFEHDDWVNDVAFSPDGSRLASVSSDGTLRLWDIFSGEMISKFSVSREMTSIAWSPDGKTIAFAGEDCLVRLWDITSGSLVEYP